MGRRELFAICFVAAVVAAIELQFGDNPASNSLVDVRQPADEEELTALVVTTKRSHPEWGFRKIHGEVKRLKPDWAVRDKRVRKLLTALSESAPGEEPTDDEKVCCAKVC